MWSSCLGASILNGLSRTASLVSWELNMVPWFCAFASGICREGENLVVGPTDDGKFLQLKVCSIQRNRSACRVLRAGQAATLALGHFDRSLLRKVSPHLTSASCGSKMFSVPALWREMCLKTWRYYEECRWWILLKLLLEKILKCHRQEPPWYKPLGQWALCLGSTHFDSGLGDGE